MKENKKELLEVILVFIVGVLSIMLLSWNAKQYDLTHPSENISSYYN